jgi:hypothetical protein
MIANILNDIGTEIVESVRELHLQAGQRASGRAYDEFEYRVEHIDTGWKLIVWGIRYSEYLNRGRGGGKVPAGFRHIIKEWAITKGLGFGSEKELNSFAFLTARKIASEGTFHSRMGRTFSGVESPISQAITEEKMKPIRQQILNEFKDAVIITRKGINNEGFNISTNRE